MPVARERRGTMRKPDSPPARVVEVQKAVQAGIVDLNADCAVRAVAAGSVRVLRQHALREFWQQQLS